MKMQLLRILRFSLLSINSTFVFFLSADNASATKYWRNGVTNGTWNTATNWSSISPSDTTTSGVPAGGEGVNIVNSDGTARTVTYDVNCAGFGPGGD